MKKLLLFLSVITVVALMTSCIERNNSYNDRDLVYIAVSENGVLHGRTTGRIITSRNIRQGLPTADGVVFEPGNFYIFSFHWEEANGRVALGENVAADSVTITSPVIEVPSASLTMSPPEDLPNMQSFVSILQPWFERDAFWWGDNWIFSFLYRGGVNPPELEFFKRDNPENSDNIDIDIRIPTSSTGTNPQDREGIVAVNMSELRSKYQLEDRDRMLNIRFHFYQEGQATLHTSEPIPWRLIRPSQQ